MGHLLITGTCSTIPATSLKRTYRLCTLAYLFQNFTDKIKTLEPRCSINETWKRLKQGYKILYNANTELLSRIILQIYDLRRTINAVVENSVGEVGEVSASEKYGSLRGVSGVKGETKGGRKKKERYVQRTQITFSPDKASCRTHHNDVSLSHGSSSNATYPWALELSGTLRANILFSRRFHAAEYERRSGINISPRIDNRLARPVAVKCIERSRFAKYCVTTYVQSVLPRNVGFFAGVFYMQSVAFARVLGLPRGLDRTETEPAERDAGNFTAGLLRPTCLETRRAARNI